MRLVPIRTAPGMNVREHWAARASRVRREREATAYILGNGKRPGLPCICVLTRVGPSNGLDDDNLAGACKGVRDQVAEWLGVDDRKREIVRYRYEQRRTRGWGVEITFQPLEPA